jgi:drug/metabolite transporter (DMT)-like permease
MAVPGWVFLAAMIAAYGAANLLQSVAAARTRPARSLHPGLLVRLCVQRSYLAGVGCQLLGFMLAFLARRDLPLFLVQASMAAGLGVTALLGVLLLGWRLPLAEVALLVLLGAAVAALIVAARPAPSRPVGTAAELALAAALLAIAGGGALAARLRGAAGSVALGGLAGLCFGAAAVASRPLAGVSTVDALLAGPLLYLMLAHSLVGQLLLALAMQRGATTAAVAAMDAAAAAPAAAVGLVLLGDETWPGREWLAALGFLAALAAVLGLTRYARPQHGPDQVTGAPAVPAATSTSTSTARPDRSRPLPARRPGRMRPGVLRQPDW